MKSILSKPYVLLDIPEITNFSLKFVYNFFVQNESISSDTTLDILAKYSGAQINESQKLSFVPRFVELSWKPVIGFQGDSTNIENNLEKIISEEHFAPKDNTSFVFLDDGNKKLEEINKFIDQNSLSTSYDGMDFFDGFGIKIEKDDFFDEISTDGILLSSVAKKIFEESLKRPDHTLSSDLLDAYRIVENSKDPNKTVLGSDYNFNLVPEKISGNFDISQKNTEYVGYIIDKFEMSEDGRSYKRLSPIVIPSIKTQKFIDYEVLYYKKYTYQIRTIARLRISSYDELSDLNVSASYLVSSRASTAKIVSCEENVPPPPPVDITAFYDWDAKKPVFSWSLPVNKQRDIKKFQVFSRKSIKESFLLEIEYDFDDSAKKFNPIENIKESLVKKKFSTIWRDEEYVSGTEKIYSVVSVDAHGLSSLYSDQIAIKYDQSKNYLFVKTICPQGCPKQYPNLNLKADVQKDSIMLENKETLKIIPAFEYGKVLLNNNEKFSIIFEQEGTYNLSFLEIDKSREDSLKITIKDNRTKVEQANPGVGLIPDYAKKISSNQENG